MAKTGDLLKASVVFRCIKGAESASGTLRMCYEGGSFEIGGRPASFGVPISGGLQITFDRDDWLLSGEDIAKAFCAAIAGEEE